MKYGQIRVKKASEQLAPAPHIAPDIVQITVEGEVLTDKAKSEIFLFMMKKYMGVERFAELIEEHGNELEVYGFITSAAEAKQTVDAIQKAHKIEKRNRSIMAIAMKVASKKDAELAKRYQELQDEEKRLMAQIEEKYMAEAKTLYTDLLTEFTRKAMAMSGHVGQQIKDIMADLRGIN